MRSKIFIFFMIIGIMAGNFAFFQKAEATGLPVVDVVSNTIQGTSLVKEITQWIKEDAFAALRDIAAKRIIDSMVNDTTKWIQGEGKPKFITDWKKFIKDAGDAAAGDVIKETAAAFVCSPFKVQLQFALQPTQIYQKQITCTLTEALDNIEAFYNDFSQGGWITYNQIWAPGGNFYSTYLMATNEITNRSAQAQNAAQAEAQASAGFEPVTKKGECLEFESYETIKKGCSQKFSEGSPEYESCVENQWAKAECIKRAPDEIINPGKSVGDIAANALGAEGQWATNISSWTSVLVNALINRVTKEGVDFAGKTVSKIVNGGGSNGGTAGGISGTSGTASVADNFQQLIDQKTISENQNMMAELQKFIDFDWDYFSQLKNESLIILKKNYAIASMIEYKKSLDSSVACNLPFGFQYRPKSIERQIKQLINEVQNLEKNFPKIQVSSTQLIAEIKLAVNPEERLRIQQEYADFIANYSLGDANSAEQEWQDFESTLATFWKEFDRPECYDLFKENDLPDVADRLLQGENISDILLHPNN